MTLEEKIYYLIKKISVKYQHVFFFNQHSFYVEVKSIPLIDFSNIPKLKSFYAHCIINHLARHLKLFWLVKTIDWIEYRNRLLLLHFLLIEFHISFKFNSSNIIQRILSQLFEKGWKLRWTFMRKEERYLLKIH